MHTDQVRTLTIAELDQVSGGQLHQCTVSPRLQKINDDMKRYWATQSSYDSRDLAADLAGAAGGAKT